MAQNILQDIHNFVYSKPRLVTFLTEFEKIIEQNTNSEPQFVLSNELEVMYIFLFCTLEIPHMFFDLDPEDPLSSQVCASATDFIISNFIVNKPISFMDLQFYVSNEYEQLHIKIMDVTLSLTPVDHTLLDEKYVDLILQHSKINLNPIDRTVDKMKNSIKNGTKNSINNIKESTFIQNNIWWIMILIFVALLAIFAD